MNCLGFLSAEEQRMEEKRHGTPGARSSSGLLPLPWRMEAADEDKVRETVDRRPRCNTTGDKKSKTEEKKGLGILAEQERCSHLSTPRTWFL